MSGSYGLLARSWRRVHPGRNPVARPWDRIEAAMLIGVVLGALMAIPLAAVVGSTAYAGQLALSAQQKSDRHPTTAILMADAPPVAVTGEDRPFDANATNVPARWMVNGAERRGNVGAHPGERAGNTVPIWLTRSGDLAAPPISPSDAAVNGVLAGGFVGFTALIVLAALYSAGRWCLDRQRARQWAREWALISGHWTRS